MAVEKIVEELQIDQVQSKKIAEKIPNPDSEKKIELSPPEKITKKSTVESKISINPQTSVVTPAQNWNAQRAAAIDAILSEGLNEIFLNMKPSDQKIFIKKGEEAVAKINELLNKSKININKIIAIIKDWLKIIPGVNKFFIEQEAKIKADTVIKLKNKI